MKLQLFSARHGVVWVKLGIKTFFRQPLALSGLFFLFMTSMSLLSMVPIVGNVLALTLLPVATLGLMAATRETIKGNFPMPVVLLSGFRAGRTTLRAMMILGVLYAIGFVVVLGASALFDGGKFATLYLVGGNLSSEAFQDGSFEAAGLMALSLYLPLSLLFWHAPALVLWHGLSPTKSLFFSFVACLRNFWAMAVYAAAWFLVFVVVGTTIALLASLTGSEELVAAVLFPTAMLMASMFFTSMYFTFADCFGENTVHLA
jgi:hypothetical protein